MRLLDRYLLRELIVPFGYCLIGFLIFWISFDLFAELEMFQKLRLRAAEVVWYYAFKIPEFLAVVLPVALLLALLYALSNHARHHELTAIRAAGVSLGRLALPYLVLGFLLSLALFWFSERLAPLGADAADRILSRREASAGARPRQIEHRYAFRNAPANRSWVMGAFDLVSGEMARPHVSWYQPDGGMREIFAERGWHEQGIWTFTNVQVLVYPPGRGDVYNTRTYETNLVAVPEFTETPEDIRSDIKVRKITGLREARRTQLSIREILAYRKLNPDDHERRAILDTKLHGRLAAPWTCLVVVLIALPFGAASGRRNVFVGVASSIVICFGFFVLSQLGLALGARGAVPAWLAAWGPNLFFGLGGILFTWRVR